MSFHRNCLRLLLGIHFQQRDDNDPHKVQFKRVVDDAVEKLKSYGIGHEFVVLSGLMTNAWSHPVLTTIMTDQDVDEEKGKFYICL